MVVLTKSGMRFPVKERTTTVEAHMKAVFALSKKNFCGLKFKLGLDGNFLWLLLPSLFSEILKTLLELPHTFLRSYTFYSLCVCKLNLFVFTNVLI